MNKDLKTIKTFWEAKAKEYGGSHKSSWEDHFCMQLEIDTLSSYITEGDRVLDIGCGNGISTLELAMNKKISIKGIDYAEEMISTAVKLHDESSDRGLKGTVFFAVGDVLDLQEGKHSFTKALTRRVIINLGSVDNQISASRNIHRILEPGGYFLMSEATVEGLQRINALRREFGLDELKQPWHNLYINGKYFTKSISHIFKLVDIVDFSSTYYIGSRVFQPFLKGMLSQSTDYSSEINRLFAQLPSYGDYGIQKLFVFKKI